jgi:ketosteroid isomerase-like protein
MTEALALNDPTVVAEVEAAFARYETALVGNDVETLDALFLDDASTIRYGIGENLYGIEVIREFRKARSSGGLARRLEQTVITTYGKDCAVAATLFRRASAPGKIGRQMQTWIRTAGGWKVAAAHVSVIVEPA